MEEDGVRRVLDRGSIVRGRDGVPQEDLVPVEGRPQHRAAGHAGGGGGRLVPEGQALQGEIEKSCIKRKSFLSNGMQA